MYIEFSCVVKTIPYSHVCVRKIRYGTKSIRMPCSDVG